MSKSPLFRPTAVKVSSVITGITYHRDSDGDTSHNVLVNYSHDGRDFENMRMGFYSSGKSDNRIKKRVLAPQKTLFPIPLPPCARMAHFCTIPLLHCGQQPLSRENVWHNAQP
ncbi:MAG: hypothetical protein HFH80_01760 [Lachnospiraceae bacterium]|nr:hypothetical protein [Lachnospiraceae bacterium]